MWKVQQLVSCEDLGYCDFYLLTNGLFYFFFSSFVVFVNCQQKFSCVFVSILFSCFLCERSVDVVVNVYEIFMMFFDVLRFPS